MTKSKTNAEVYYNPQRGGFLWRINHVPGRFSTQPASHRSPYRTAQAARDALDKALLLLWLELPESQIKTVKFAEPKKCPET